LARYDPLVFNRIAGYGNLESRVPVSFRPVQERQLPTDTTLIIRCLHCMVGIDFRQLIAYKDGGSSAAIVPTRFVLESITSGVCVAIAATEKHTKATIMQSTPLFPFSAATRRAKGIGDRSFYEVGQSLKASAVP
jgi:hypothetical protein